MISVAFCKSFLLFQLVICPLSLKKVAAETGCKTNYLTPKSNALSIALSLSVFYNKYIYEPCVRLWMFTFNNILRLILMIRPQGNTALIHLNAPNGRLKRKSREFWEACSESWHLLKKSLLGIKYMLWKPLHCWAEPSLFDIWVQRIYHWAENVFMFSYYFPALSLVFLAL